jgi:hypothetical protein
MKSIPLYILAAALLAFAVHGTGAPTSAPAQCVNNVRDFGATGDGVTDDTAAIQRAIDALPPQGLHGAGVVYFPSGFYRVTNLSPGNRSVIFQGAGWACQAEGLPGANQYLHHENLNGSVLFCTAKTGAAITVPLNFALNHSIRDLMVLGADVPGVTGLDLGWQTNTHNVNVVNFDTGVSMKGAVGWRMSELSIRGCNVGLAMKACTACQFDLLKVTWCRTHAIQMTWSSGNQFNSPDVESNHCGTTILMQDDGVTGSGIGPNPGHGCRGNIFQNLWAENPAFPSAPGQPPATAWLFDIGASSIGNDFNQLHINGGTADRIHVARPDNHFGQIQQTPWGGGDTVLEKTATGFVAPANVNVVQAAKP